MNNSLQEQREMNQFAFFSLSHEANNRFDYIADEAIMRLETEIEKSCEAYSQLESIRQNEPEKWKRMEREAHERDMDLSGEFNSYALDTVYRTEEMIVLMEMKVIYAWKHLEIYIKKLISEAYPEINTKDFYKWNSLVAFLKSKGIRPDTLDGYAEIIQLQKVNNKAKHTELSCKELQSIPEFKDNGALSYESIEKFYGRVKNSPNKFLKALYEAIDRELIR